MKRLTFTLCFVLLLVVAVPSTGFNRIYFPPIVDPLYWEKGTAHMYLDGPGFPSGSTWWQGLRNSMNDWTAVSECAFWFTWTNAGSGTGTWYSVSWHLDGANDVFWITGLLDNWTYAATMFSYHGVNYTPLMYDTEVMFNADIGWSTTGNPNLPDFESVAIHEFGHVLGIDEASDTSAVMYGYLSTGQIRRTLTPDDIAAARTIYPEENYEAPPPPPGPSVDIVALSILDLELPDHDVSYGETIRVAGTVKNVDRKDRTATVNALVMDPSVISKTKKLTLAPDEQVDFEFDAVVISCPGRYPVTVKITGYDGEEYSAGAVQTNQELTVNRGPIGMVMQDTVMADLGPHGVDRVRLPLLKGSKVTLDLRKSSFSWSGEREFAVVSPSGKTIRTASGRDTVSLKRFRAKEAGDHILKVTNHGDTEGTYVLLSSGTPKKKKSKGKVVLASGEESGELSLPNLPARSVIDVQLKAKTKGFSPPVITGYYTPSKVRVEFEEPADGLYDFPVNENGVYRLLLQLPDGPAPKKVRVKAKAKITIVDGVTHRD